MVIRCYRVARGSSGDETALYLDCGGSYMKLHVLKLHRNKSKTVLYIFLVNTDILQ